jgi:hypothetical protein
LFWPEGEGQLWTSKAKKRTDTFVWWLVSSTSVGRHGRIQPGVGASKRPDWRRSTGLGARPAIASREASFLRGAGGLRGLMPTSCAPDRDRRSVDRLAVWRLDPQDLSSTI